MSFLQRIRMIYAKELTDILRDRRTLIAMIVVPIVLYPLLMLGSVQAVSLQMDSLSQEILYIGVVGQEQREYVSHLIAIDAAYLRHRKQSAADVDQDNAARIPEPLDSARIVECANREQLEQGIRDRAIHIGLIVEDAAPPDALDRRTKITPLADLEEARSRSAYDRIMGMLDRNKEEMVQARLRAHNLPPAFVSPYEITTVDLSAPASILGQILPLVLVLMTITGAIYPAIDLTAGERERGTLETLMVCPVAVIDLIVGKFLVVTTVAIMGAALNLASVSATVYFGGFDQVIASSGDTMRIGTMLLILLSLIPFAVLMSAIMIAVCSYARTFKEAQNYVTPVILAVLIPGGIAALPATRPEGVMLVMPVGNMVLLTRELLLGAIIPAWQVIIILASTTLYAGAAVAIAANTFGKETVVFADAGSLKNIFARSRMKPRDYPSIASILLFVALLFPLWFFIQSSLSPAADESALGLLTGTATLMPALFLILPAMLLLYGKVRLPAAFGCRLPTGRHVLGAVLIGASIWVLAHELNTLQQILMPIPSAVLEGLAKIEQTIGAMPPWQGLLYLAVIPAVCEEFLFRGLLLGVLGKALRRWWAIIIAATIFSVFHFMLFRFIPVAILGIVLGYVCWQSRSVIPAMLIHLLHNGITVSSAYWPWRERIGWLPDESNGHLPVQLLVMGGVTLAAGLFLCRRLAPLQNPLTDNVGPQESQPALPH